MDWKLKAAIYRLFDGIPFGHEAYSFSQRNLTKSLPRSFAGFDRYLAQFYKHMAAFERNGGKVQGATYFEFGVGWDLFYPLCFALAGTSKQFLFDLNRYAKPEYINHVLRGFENHRSDHFLKHFPGIESIGGLKGLGIDYRAPADASATGLPSNSIDLASTTSVLEHVPVSSIRNILIEMKRICKEGSLASMLVDYEDHYAQRLVGIGVYNFLQYSDAQWTKFNPGIHFQNRLRHSDYVSLFKDADFEIVEMSGDVPDDWEAQLARISLAPEFQAYDKADLKITRGHFVLRA